MKKLIFISALTIALITIVFYACKKAATSPLSKSNQSSALIIRSDADQKAPCDNGKDTNSTLRKAEDGKWTCDGEKCDCHCSTCGSAIVHGKRPDLTQLKGAILEGKVREFFMTNKWRPVLPELSNKPDIIERLRKGELDMVQKENNPADGRIFFIIVKEGTKSSELTSSDVVLAWEFSTVN